MVAEGAIVMEAEDLPSWRQRQKYITLFMTAWTSFSSPGLTGLMSSRITHANHKFSFRQVNRISSHFVVGVRTPHPDLVAFGLVVGHGCSQGCEGLIFRASRSGFLLVLLLRGR